MTKNNIKLKTSFICSQCGADHFLLTKKEITETTAETLFINIHNYADTRFMLTCCACNNTFKIIDMETIYE